MLTVNGRKRTDIVAVLKSKSENKNIKTEVDISLNKETFEDINLNHSELLNVEFIECTIKDLIIKNTNISTIRLTCCKIESILFENCHIENIIINGCKILNSNINKCYTRYFSSVNNEYISYYINNCNIHILKLYKNNITNFNFQSSICEEVKIDKAIIVSSFEITDVFSTRSFNLIYSNINAATLRGNTIRSGYFSNNNIEHVHISNNIIINMELSNNSISKKIFANGNRFENCNFNNFDINDYENIIIKCSKCNKITGSELDIQIFKTMCILPEGDIIGWKKCRNNKVLKLLIPEHALRSNFYRKCRASEAKVLEIYYYIELNNSIQLTNDNFAVSMYDSQYIYTVGETMRPRYDFNQFETQECASGIHFFITKEEAMNFLL